MVPQGLEPVPPLDGSAAARQDDAVVVHCSARRDSRMPFGIGGGKKRLIIRKYTALTEGGLRKE